MSHSGAERKVSDYIDRLNAEKKPDENEYSTESEHLQELYRTVRSVRSLREPAMPQSESDFQKKLIRSVANPRRRRRRSKSKSVGFIGAACAAALFILLITFMNPFGSPDVVSAMDKAFREVEAYHGTLEVVETNANGESFKQGEWEVWADKGGHYYIKGLEGANQNLVTVNNGQKKWQVQPDRKEVQIFPALPDGYRFQFELGEEVQDAKNALSTRAIGEDTVAGRTASILEVTPEGGLPYRIWIDKETKLPLQKQTAMNHAVQYTLTYTRIAFDDAIPGPLLSYRLPEGFKEINANPEQLVSDLNEAQDIAGFTPFMPARIATGYVQDRLGVIPDQRLVKMYYNAQGSNKQVVVEQRPSTGELKPASNAALGKMNDGVVEIQAPVAEDSEVSSIRWQQDGIELTVLGNLPVDDLASFAEKFMNGPLEMPSLSQTRDKPEVEVPYDLTVEKNDQKNADAGSSPWKLDPVFVAQVFVSLQMSPGGITGDYPIATKDLEVAWNDGKTAIISVNDDKSPIAKVYVQRLVRQDATGIWTVVGYDPRK